MFFAASLALLLQTSNHVTEQTLPEFLTRMRAQSGPVWQAPLLSSSFVVTGGTEVAISTTTYGRTFRTSSCEGSLCSGSYFDGIRLYDVDINHSAVLEGSGDDPYLRGERTIASMYFLSPTFTREDGRIVDRGMQPIHGQQLRELTLYEGDATPFDLFIDARSHRISYFRASGTRDLMEYRDYRSVAGRFLLPFLVLRNGSVLERYVSRDVAAAPPIKPDGVIATPSAPVTLPLSASMIVPVIACSLDGIAASCLIDSGNSGLSISPELAARVGAQRVGTFTVNGLGNETTDVVRAGNLRIGSIRADDANFVVLPEIHQFNYDIVLGADFFAQTTVQLDAQHGRMVVGATRPQTTPIAMRFSDFVPIASTTLATQTNVDLALDTGDESTVNLSSDFYSAHPTLFTTTSQRAVNGVGGSSVEFLGTLSTFQIGDVLARNVTIGTTAMLRGTGYGHIGAGFFNDYAVTFSYADASCWISAPTR